MGNISMQILTYDIFHCFLLLHLFDVGMNERIFSIQLRTQIIAQIAIIKEKYFHNMTDMIIKKYRDSIKP